MRSRQKRRIFVGFHEIGDYTLCLSKGLRELGFQVSNVVLEINSELSMREDRHDRYIKRSSRFIVMQMRLFVELIRQILRQDVFVFNFSRSFLSSFMSSRLPFARSIGALELVVLKRLGKKIVNVVNGSDLRSVRLLAEELLRDGLTEHAKYVASELAFLDEDHLEEQRRVKAAFIERYADYIFVRPNAAQLLKNNHPFLWVPIDLRTVRFAVPDDESPLVLHAPSKRRIKGTGFVNEAVDQLKREGYNFRFELCENMSNIEVRERLTQSQIVIDQLILPGYGLFAIEAMATGNAVIGSAVPGYNGFARDMPVLTTTPSSIYRNLKWIIENRRPRVELAIKGRKWVEKYHDHRVVTRNFAESIGEWSG